jgi:hypothetical protein
MDTIPMITELSNGLYRLKHAMQKKLSASSIIREPIPLVRSNLIPLDDSLLAAVHEFVRENPIYTKSYECNIGDVPCVVYEGDSTPYWLHSKKNDSNYQPFYATWMLSALTLALQAKSLGYQRVIDIGAGDGRIPYCAKVVGLKSYGIELDEELVGLQKTIRSATGVDFDSIQSDATEFDYGQVGLDQSLFFISALPELGEMIANSVIGRILGSSPQQDIGFTLMGSYAMPSMAKDFTYFGWGNIIEHFNLKVLQIIALPTQWTADLDSNTPYLCTTNRIN